MRFIQWLRMKAGKSYYTQGEPLPFWCYDYERLARYNSEVSRGISHTAAMKSEMAGLQVKYNADMAKGGE